MGQRIDLLKSLPKTQRDVAARAEAKDPKVVATAKEYGKDYFDGDRKYGYGGYKYDGRWKSVAQGALDHYFGPCDPVAAIAARVFGNGRGPRILDVGCAKGFLVKDLCDADVDAYGLDISYYAVGQQPHPDVVGRLHHGDARSLPFPDQSFDLVLSINTLHNLPKFGAAVALQEIKRVKKVDGHAFVQVDAYEDPAGRQRFLDWVLTAEFHGYPDDWLELFAYAGYDGDYDWTII